MAASSLPEGWSTKPCLICREPAHWLLCQAHLTSAADACDAAYAQLKDRFEARYGAALDAWLAAGKLPGVAMVWYEPGEIVRGIIETLASRYDEALYVTSGSRWAGWECRRGAEIIAGTRGLSQRLRVALQASIADLSTDVEQAEILRAIMHPEDEDPWYEAWQIINDLAHVLPSGFYELINMRYDKLDCAFDPSMRGGALEGCWRQDLDLLPAWLANFAVTCWLEDDFSVA